MEDKKIIAKEALNGLQELEMTTRLEETIKDNKVEFCVGDDTFRVRLPELKEKEELQVVKRKKYNELITDDSYFFRKQWIERYKKKGIDIVKMEREIQLIMDDQKKLLLRLAKLTNVKDVEKIQKEIMKLQDKVSEKHIEVTDLMEVSIEDRMAIFVNGYMSYLVLEIKNKERKFEKYFKTYKDFEKCENWELVIKMQRSLSYLINELR